MALDSLQEDRALLKYIFLINLKGNTPTEGNMKDDDFKWLKWDVIT